MTPHLGDADLSAIIIAAEDEDNPLGIENPISKADQAVETIYQAIEGVDGETAGRLVKSLERWTRKSNAVCPIDRITAQFLAHAGLDPLVLTWITTILGQLTLTDDDDMEELAYITRDQSPADELNAGSVHIGDGTYWRICGEVLIEHRFPATLSVAATGRRLRDVVTHPVLDMYPLSILECRDFTGNRQTLVTDVKHDILTPRQLMSIAPCGCR